MILILGSNGSMGKRYQAILTYLGLKFIAIDKCSIINALRLFLLCDKVIICTPTDTHFEYLKFLIPMKIKILCEKPVTKNINELQIISRLCEIHSNPITMVMQYSSLFDHGKTGNSSYDYFRTGNDGIYWDCMQIITFATGDIYINNKSPIWRCTLNGTKLNIADMDNAYIDFISRWVLSDEMMTMDFIINSHKKVIEYATRQKNN